MLPPKLQALKEYLETRSFLSEGDKELVKILDIIDTDTNIQRILIRDARIQESKAFEPAGNSCSCCGRDF